MRWLLLAWKRVGSLAAICRCKRRSEAREAKAKAQEKYPFVAIIDMETPPLFSIGQGPCRKDVHESDMPQLSLMEV